MFENAPIIISLIIVIGVFYFTLIGLYIFGFLKITKFKNAEHQQKNISEPMISLIIALRNEEKNIPNLLQSLKNQTINKNLFEIIFIDDFSSDNTKKLIENAVKQKYNYKFAQLSENSGKKEAINYGIAISSGKLIVTTDADCTFNKNWLKTILNFYFMEKPKLIIAPVSFSGNSFFQNFQKLEFLSLQVSTAGACGINSATMCNGANLAYEKKAFLEITDAMNKNQTSGDDVFLLHKFKKKYPKEILYLKNRDAIVKTEAEKSLKTFINQRIRWASKAKYYSDFHTIASSLIVFLTNIFVAFLFVATILDTSIFVPAFIFFSVKTFLDFLLMMLFAESFKISFKIFRISPFLILIYPFYIIFTATISLFSKKYEWKNRNVKV